MKKILVYENPEHTIQVKILNTKKPDLYESIMPKPSINVEIDGQAVNLDLIEVEYITK